MRVLERTCFQYRPLTLPSIIFYRFWTDLRIVFQFFRRFCDANFAKTKNFLNTKREAKSQPRTRQDQTRSNKINQTIAKHKPANTTHRKRARHAEPKNEGAAVSRRMASSIRSGPGGTRRPRRVCGWSCLTLSGINVTVVRN